MHLFRPEKAFEPDNDEEGPGKPMFRISSTAGKFRANRQQSFWTNEDCPT
jgi:hypothetical protein